MSIDFSKERWDRIKEESTAWWNGDLERPLVQVAVGGRAPSRPEPKIPQHHFTAFYDLSIPAEDIVDMWDYNLSCTKFYGDSFPVIFPNFGPGVVAAFLGAEMGVSIEAGTCWFYPKEVVGLDELNLRFDPDNAWFRRIEDIYRAGVERWEGMVHMSMTDLGGNLDVLSSFRPSENLLFDLYDHPTKVKELTWQIHDLWWQCFNRFNSILRPVNPGYSAWASIFSTEPSYMLQCDFCYMISPDMFDEFVKPELAACCRRMPHAFYHLDGPGQLPHLDSLLDIPELKGVQWVPGSGVPGFRHWPEVYRKIRDAGKLIQLYGTVEDLDAVVEQLGTCKGIVFIGWVTSEDEAIACAEKYGAM